MERRKQEEIEVSTSHQTTGTLALKNFTIPRKKRTSGQVVLERCPEESRDYTLIQSKLRDSRLDTRKDRANTWIWKDVHLVHNDELLQKFSEKRVEMRAKGRHGREMEERFCFLVASDQDMPHMYQDGLKVGSSVQHTLGKPAHGVYLFRHVDVALKSTTSTSATHLLIFKVLYGKVRKIAPNLTWKKSQDPVVSFDCHMSKDALSPRDTPLQQVLGSSVFLFDFNENQELNERPRQCLPYAVVSYAPASSVILTTSLNLPFSPTSHADHFQACTVAQRKGKGDTATITYKHFGTTQNPGVDYVYQKADVQSIPISHNSMLDHTTVSQNLLREEANHKRNTAGTRETWDKCDTTPQSPIDKVSTIVYSSRSVRDPRLSRREANQQSNFSAEETLRTASRNEDGPQNEDANSGFVTATSESGPKEPSNDECSLQCSLNICVHTQKQKAETLPSIKLFKMKFQKYAKYFRLNEEERHNKIWSLENMSPEQKRTLLDRIQFYEVYYQKYKKGLLYQNVNGVETEKTSSLSLKQPQENHITLSQSDVSQTINNKANNSSKTTCFVDSRNTDNTYMNQSKHQHDPEHCAGILPENKQDQEYVQHVNGCLVSKPFLEVGSLNLNLMNENVYLKEHAPSSCSFREKSNQNIKHQSEPSTGTGEDTGNESGLVELVERPGHESVNMFADNITAMDIASFVEGLSCGMSENGNPNSAMAERREQDGQNYRSSFFPNSISPELNVATLQENSSTHIGLYQRLQLDELVPSQNGVQIFSSRAYLTPRVTPTDTKDQSKTEPRGMRCWKDPHLIVTLKANNTPAHTAGTIALSERFSKLKSCQKKASALVEEYNETGSSNVKLIKLLAKRYNMTKLHAKCRSLNKPQTSALALGRSLRTKYVKKKHFWKVKKSICSNVVSTESSHEAAHRTTTSDNPSHTSKIDLPESTDQEPDPNLRKMSHTSDAACDEQQLHIQVNQGANAITNLFQDVCSPINDLIPLPGFKTSSETKEEETKPVEPLLLDSFCTNTNKPTDDITVNPIPVIVNKVEQVKDTANENKTSLIKHDSNEDISQDYACTFTEEKSVLQEVTSHMTPDPLCRVELNSEKLSEDVKASESLSSFSQPMTLLTPKSKVMCDSEVDYIETCEINIPNNNQSSTNAKSGAWAIDTETNSQMEVLIEEGPSDLQHCTKQAWKCTSNNIPDLTDENSSLSGQCEMAPEHPNSINTSLLDVKVSDTKHASAAMINENCHFYRPEQNQNYDVDSPETQLISKLRDYLTKFESSVKKQEAANEGLRDKPVVWITLDSTAHKQQLADKGQYRSRPNDEAQTGHDVYLLVPAESKRGRSSQAKRTSRNKSKRARWSSCPSVSPDSTSALDTVKETSPQPSVNNGTAALTEISLSNEAKPQFMQSKESTSSIICSQDPVDTCGNGEHKPHTNREIVDDGDVSSSFVSSDLSVNDISNTLKMADQTSSLAELGSLQSKCKNMLQQFILKFERDQIVSFNQSFVSRNLIVEQYLDHPPAHVDLKYEAVNSYLELQMMMEAWQFVENKMNFLKNKPTFRSLLWYDPSLYGELYKGEVGFQQQSSLFTSFQKMLAQEGYAKLQEYYMTHVSRIYQQLLVNPDASYYMYLKSKREVFEIEAAVRNPHDVKYFFLSVPLTAMINFGDSLESLENVHKVIMTFVETPSDQLPGTFDVGKAEHLSITCRYLQEKAFFIRSCKETLTKVSWFGTEHLLYDASKILIWQDVGQGVSNEVLKMYKNSNPQIIFGVTESGVTLVNKVQQPRLSMNGAEKSAEKQTDASQKHEPSQSNVLQTVNSGREADYSMCKRRETHPGITPRTMNDNGANPLYQTPSAHAGNSTPYNTPHQNNTSVHWGMMNTWNAPSTSHVHSEIKSFLTRRRVSSSHADQRTSLSDVRRVQAVREQKWPLMLAPQTTSQADSFVSRPRFRSVKHQQTSTASHCPMPSKEQANRFSLATAQPFSLPNFPLNANFVAPHSLSRFPVPNTLPAISYPYFLLNGQTYTTDSTAAIHPYTRYYPNTV
ncbi:uncharacterized protein LOC130550620 isoform X2 [Triplophysa rosa]|uniref:uncharacterized protein LOC130550620 isoform X2 n=1 Tax=Triplophysa rosa TaxID=992332 RepID=UPI002545E75A|nr:uncharacterized protein LOC130550620 isoform X2 [Triplophysa rosa]